MQIETLVICDNNEIAAEIERAIDGVSSLKMLEIVSSTDGLSSTKRLRPRIVWVDLNSSVVMGLAFIAELMEELPGLIVWASHNDEDSEVIRTVFRLGGTRFFTPDKWNTELEAACKLAQERLDNDNQNELKTASIKSSPLESLIISDSRNNSILLKQLLDKNKKSNHYGTYSTQQAKEEISESKPDLILLDISLDPESTLSMISEVKLISPDTDIIVFHHYCDPSQLQTAFRMGAADFLDLERMNLDFSATVNHLLGEDSDHKGKSNSSLITNIVLVVLVIVAIALYNLK